jgi:hypothetical protein
VPYQFRKHYTREEARGLLPRIRLWLNRLHELRHLLADPDPELSRLTAKGHDLGGERVNRRVGLLAELQELVSEFQSREIQIKDLERGLVDFPAILAGKEVFLCWEQGEEDVEYWHELDAGFAGRAPL